MKRDEQEQNTPGALLMENISSVLGSANGDLDPGRNTVIFSVCGDKEQDFSQHRLLSHLAVAPMDFSSLSLRCTGGVPGKRWEGSMGLGYKPQKVDSETPRFASKGRTGECSPEPHL